MKTPSQQTKLNFFGVTRNATPSKSSGSRLADKARTPAPIARRHGTAYSDPSASTATLTSSPPQARQPSSPPSTSPEPTMETLPDSTDWISTSLPSFEPLEAALRCEVCKEFFETPVITTCSHTFCSLCIRRCVASDGKCPACKMEVRTDKLVPNTVVREVVARFQDARPKAMELAQKKNDVQVESGKKKNKRKLEDTDIEEEEPARHTRSRVTRSSSRRGNGMVDAPIEVADSDHDGDEEFIPDGLVACPMCGTHMKEDFVWQHTESCTGERKSSNRNARKANTAFSSPARAKSKSTTPAPAPSRLPGVNFAMLTEAKTRKKLQELGIPNWGKKELMIKRHTEWLHLWNSNCDAPEEFRKTKRELLRQLDIWERTRGGNAHTAEAAVMKKDFDKKGYADANKDHFADLIAAARKKKQTPTESQPTEPLNSVDNENGPIIDTTITDRREDGEAPSELHNERPSEPHQPYAGNGEALAVIREKVNQTSENGTIQAPNSEAEASASITQPEDTSAQAGIVSPSAAPLKKLSISARPQHPVDDAEPSKSVQD